MQSFLENRPRLGSTLTRSLRPAPSADRESFQPFSPDRAAAALETVRAGLSLDAADHPAPLIELVEKDGRIDRIIVTCSCCRRIELKCDY